MTIKEAKEMIEELKDMLALIGYELTDEFLNMSLEDQKTKGWEE